MRPARGAPSVAAGLLLTAAVAAGAGAAPLPRLGPAPNFALTTHQNDRLWLTQLRDRLVVLTFTCTECAACPGLLPGLRALSQEVGDAAGRRIFFVAVSVDPSRDTALTLRRYAREQGLDPAAWLLLTGKPTEVEVVTRRYGVGVRPADGRVVHDCVVVLIDGAGVMRGRYGVADLGRLRADLAALLGSSP